MPVSPVGCSMGCDPELFFEKNGVIIGAEKVIPPQGLVGIALDGVQVELHPVARTCRQELSEDIAGLFRTLSSHLAKGDGAVRVSFTPTVELTKKEHRSLSPESRILGCQPSYNANDPSLQGPRVNPETYRRRSAGGHIHLGSLPFDVRAGENAARFIRIMDAVLGNTCVLIDRDPHAALRRRNYGRAGEFRLPLHGIEYRTLTNFWLRSYPLMSFVFAMSKVAAGIMYCTIQYEKGQGTSYRDFTPLNAEGALFADLKRADVVKAIQKNDLDLAWKNWEKVRKFLDTHMTTNYTTGLNKTNTKAFETFAEKVQEHGLTYFWPTDPLQHWQTHNYRNRNGWENFLINLPQEMAAAEGRRLRKETKAA